MAEHKKDFEFSRTSEDESTARLIEDGVAGLPQKPAKGDGKVLRMIIAASLLANIIWTALFLFSLIHRCNRCTVSNPAHSTDFTSIRPILKPPQSTTFDDQLYYNTTSHEFWRDIDPSSAQYFGPPSPEIDSAWAGLLRGEFLGISDDELRLNVDLDFEDQDWNPVNGHFHIAIDVFHSLHCLNAVRKELDSDYYDHLGVWSAKSQRIHIDHCLNHIRQSLQCHPDLSAAAMRKQISATGDVFFLGNAKKHTCHDWGEIRSWVDERRLSELGGWGEVLGGS